MRPRGDARARAAGRPSLSRHRGPTSPAARVVPSPGRGLELELVDQPARAGQARGRGRCRSCSRPAARARRRRSPGPRRWAITSMPSRPSVAATTRRTHLALAGVGRDVARDLGDRGGDEREVGAARSRGRHPSRGPLCRAVTMSASDVIATRTAITSPSSDSSVSLSCRKASPSSRSSAVWTSSNVHARAAPWRTRRRAGCRRSPSPRRAGAPCARCRAACATRTSRSRPARRRR